MSAETRTIGAGGLEGWREVGEVMGVEAPSLVFAVSRVTWELEWGRPLSGTGTCGPPYLDSTYPLDRAVSCVICSHSPVPRAGCTGYVLGEPGLWRGRASERAETEG